MKQFYTLPEAADFLGLQPHDVLRLIQDGDLAVSFDADEELAGVTIESPDGSIEHVSSIVPMTGVLSFWGDTVVEGALTAVGVRVLKVRSITFEHTPDGVRAKGCKLPTVDTNTGHVKSGYIVRGFVNFVRVESADWLFFRDDLAAAKEGVSSGAKDAAEPPPTMATPATESAPLSKPVRGITKREIMNAFAGLCFDHEHWARNLASPPNWLKECRVAMGNKNTSALWNPALIACALFDKSIPIRELDAVFVALREWAGEWAEVSDGFR
jgi:hypothetical protein